ncbi:MAG: flagellar assembly protein FliW [Candidatus Eremiobacteraeota bacterium]|nr:flagellar assembly protein FliW [Candidatus Eremiobacteraeota bacterium]
MSESGAATLASFPRFGDFVYRESDVIEFPWGIPGFRDLHRWIFLTLESQPSFVWLQSLEDVYVSLPAANPWLIFEDYDPVVPAGAFAALNIRSADDFTYLCTVTVGPGATRMTMNLASPIVVNLRTRKAVQVTLGPSPYSNRETIPRRAATGTCKGVR